MSEAYSQARPVWTSTPPTALTSSSDVSETRIAALISPAKSAKPGASRAKRVFPPRSIVRREALIEICRFCSSV